jgi:hypothetical protein
MTSRRVRQSLFDSTLYYSLGPTEFVVSSALGGQIFVQWNSLTVSGYCTMLGEEPYIKYYLSVYMHINHNAINNVLINMKSPLTCYGVIQSTCYYPV